MGAGSILSGNTAYGEIQTVEVAPEVVYHDPASVEAAVREYFHDIPIMVQVARCESTFRHNNKDGSVLRGRVDQRDLGVMQINTYYHGDTAARLNLDLTQFEDNLAYARYLYEKQGVQPWSASQPCWGGALAANF